MKYLVELVFGLGFFGLAATALTFLMRFLLLTWAVRLAAAVVQSILGFLKRLGLAIIFILVPAVLASFIVGIGLAIIVGTTSGGPDTLRNPIMPVLIAFLTFFVIVAGRGWQWAARRGRPKNPWPVTTTSGADAGGAELGDYPEGYEPVAQAWVRAMGLAPERNLDLRQSQAACAAFLTYVETLVARPDESMIETTALIRNDLVRLVESTERRLRLATPAERHMMIDEMVKLLIGFAQRAQQDMQAASANADDADAAFRARLAGRLFG